MTVHNPEFWHRWFGRVLHFAVESGLAIKRIEYKNTKDEMKMPFLEESTKDSELEIRNWAVNELAQTVGTGTENRGLALRILKRLAKDSSNPASGKASKILEVLLNNGSIQWSELSS